MKYLAFLTAVFLVGCGSDDEGSPATLSDIVGVWDESITEGQLVDEMYTVIAEDGTVTGYDYLGDSYDNEANCYDDYAAGKLTDLGSGNFEFENGASFYITINGNSMTTNGSHEGDSWTFTSERSDRLESSFTPLCNELR